ATARATRRFCRNPRLNRNSIGLRSLDGRLGSIVRRRFSLRIATPAAKWGPQLAATATRRSRLGVVTRLIGAGGRRSAVRVRAQLFVHVTHFLSGTPCESLLFLFLLLCL